MTIPSNSPSFNTTCRFFKQGICKFGNQCRFRHNSGTADSDVMQTNAIENSASGYTANSSKNK